MLTKKQKNLLLFINKKLRSSGVSPSYEEMKQSLNLKSKSGIHRLISALEERGFIKRLANLFIKPLSSKALINLCIPDLDFKLRDCFISSYEGDTPELLNFLLINKSRFFCFFVSIRTNIVQKMFYKSSFKLTILKKTSKIGLYFT